ncbi:IS91 family transposase [Saccharophagus degradans]|uniref:Transposase n=1 Tax=Saccharophagus degradans TaxID=86304 RepID=A0AAW7X8C0_9GAMM|nr:transposase [Saccharophagus degradans]MDO6424110.1 transposase [Saccharophagus degradans]MDO6608157.1 transposase [Saccharophagus degradans]
MSDRTIQNLILSHKPYLDSIPKPLKIIKAIDKMSRCRTSAMGTSVYVCSKDNGTQEQHHSCRHRSCYLCAQKKRLEWLEKQKEKLLDCPHFHVVFTIPHEYLALWRFNESAMSRILFRAAQETLTTLIGDPKYGGVCPGIMMALHTWGRKLDLHPHVHCLVSAGGADKNGDWKALGRYLVPSGVIRAVFRGKFQAMLAQGLREYEIVLPDELTLAEFWRTYRDVYRKDWCVRIEERYEHGKGVVVYLARYCKGGPLHPKQIVSASDSHIRMSYLDHRDKRVKVQALEKRVFFQRLLSHVPAEGLHTVRYLGLYAPAAKVKYRRCVGSLGTLDGVQLPYGEQLRSMVVYCKTCGAPMNLSHQLWRPRKAISINKEGRRDCASGPVQQHDESDHANVLRKKANRYSSG